MQTTRIAAYALIYENKKILLCRLSKNVQDAAGQWTLPGGGIEFGEDPQDAMIREVREETGLEVTPIEVAFIDSIRITNDSGDYHGIRIVYRVNRVAGEIQNEIDGSTDLAKWHNLSAISEIPLVGLAERGVQFVS